MKEKKQQCVRPSEAHVFPITILENYLLLLTITQSIVKNKRITT